MVATKRVYLILLANQGMALTAGHTGNSGNGSYAVKNVMDPHRRPRVRGSAIAQLAGVIAAPRKGKGIVSAGLIQLEGDCQRVIPTGRDVHSLSQPTGLGVGIQHIFTIDHHSGKRLVLQALISQLALIVPAPTPNGAVLQQSQGEAVARRDLGNMAQRAQPSAILHRNGEGAGSRIVLAQLAVIIITGGVDLSLQLAVFFLLCHKQGMVSTRRHHRNIFQRTGGSHDLAHRVLLVGGIVIGIDLPGMTAGTAEPDLELPLILVDLVFGIGVVIDLDNLSRSAVCPNHVTAVSIVVIPALSALAEEGILRGHIPSDAAAAQKLVTGPFSVAHRLCRPGIAERNGVDNALVVNGKHVSLHVGDALTPGRVIGDIVGHMVNGILIDIFLTLILIANDQGRIHRIEDRRTGIGGSHGRIAVDGSFLGDGPQGGIPCRAIVVGAGLRPVGGHIIHGDRIPGRTGHALQLTDYPGHAVLIHKDREGIAHGHIPDAEEGLSLVGHLDGIAAGESAAVAQLPMAVVAPSPDRAVRAQYSRMIFPCRDLGCGKVIAVIRRHYHYGNNPHDPRALADGEDLGGTTDPAGGVMHAGRVHPVQRQDLLVHHIEIQIARGYRRGGIVLVEVKAQIHIEAGGSSKVEAQPLVHSHDHRLAQTKGGAGGCPVGAGGIGQISPQIQLGEALLTHPDRDPAVKHIKVAQLAQITGTRGIHIAVIDAEGNVIAAYADGPGGLHIFTSIGVGSAGAIHRIAKGVGVDRHLDRLLRILGIRYLANDPIVDAHLAPGIVAPGKQRYRTALIGGLDQRGVPARGHTDRIRRNQKGYRALRHLGRVSAHLAMVVAAPCVAVDYRAGSRHFRTHGNGMTIAGGDAHDCIQIFCTVNTGRAVATAEGIRFIAEGPSAGVTQLPVRVVAPGHQHTVAANGVSGCSAGSDLHHTGQGISVVAGAAALYHFPGIVGVRTLLPHIAQTQLAVSLDLTSIGSHCGIAIIAPAIDLSALGQCKSEVLACGDGYDRIHLIIGGRIVIQLTQHLGAQNGLAVDPDHGGNMVNAAVIDRSRGAVNGVVGRDMSQLPHLVPAPGPDSAKVIQGQGKAVAGFHIGKGNVPFRSRGVRIGQPRQNAHRCHLKPRSAGGVDITGREHLVTQLTVSPFTPSIYLTFGGQCHRVRFSGRDLGNSGYRSNFGKDAGAGRTLSAREIGRVILMPTGRTHLYGRVILLHMTDHHRQHHGVGHFICLILIEDSHRSGAQFAVGSQRHQHTADAADLGDPQDLRIGDHDLKVIEI